MYCSIVSFGKKVDSTVESGNLDKQGLGLTVIYALLHLNQLHPVNSKETGTIPACKPNFEAFVKADMQVIPSPP